MLCMKSMAWLAVRFTDLLAQFTGLWVMLRYPDGFSAGGEMMNRHWPGRPEYRFVRILRRYLGLSALACLTLGLSACAGLPAVGPDYQAPEATQLLADEQWQAALPHGGLSTDLLHWWQSFHDPLLDRLLQRAELDSPTLAEAVARIDEARSLFDGHRASLLPQVQVEAHQLRNNGSADLPGIMQITGGKTFDIPVQTAKGTRLDAQWEIDLFGRVRRGNEAAEAALHSAEQGWHAARISLAAEVAGRYIDLRSCQLSLQTLKTDLASRQETARITQVAAEAGLQAPADARLAAASAADMAGILAAQAASCRLLQKTLVRLTGISESELMRELADSPPSRLPQPASFAVDALPVALLSQRPDLAAAERQLAAANAQVGVATANRYPRLSLVGELARDRSSIDGMGSWISKPWYFGPSLSLPLFTGGALTAAQEAARARYAQALARYRQAVRLAVEETEGALVNLHAATERSQQAEQAYADYHAYFTAVEENWRAGGLSLLALETARRLSTAAERNRLEVERSRIQSWIALYKALGGGWQQNAAAKVEPVPAEATSKKAEQPAEADFSARSISSSTSVAIASGASS